MLQHFWAGASATSKNCRGKNSISGQGDFSDVQTENPHFFHTKKYLEWIFSGWQHPRLGLPWSL